MLKALRSHWVDYLIEAWGLGIFMILAGVMTSIIQAPGSPIQQALPDPLFRRALIGIAMGLTAISIIYSPWGKRSGAHINPAVTLAFYRLGKIQPWDAVFYMLAQFMGGVSGVSLVSLFLGSTFTDPPILYIVTIPGIGGILLALVMEFLMAFGLMTMVLWVSNSSRWSQFTGVCAGIMVASYITLLAPFSGMSINPARTFASAFPAQIWTAWWVYLIGPTLAMQTATEIYLRLTRKPPLSLCGKLCPNGDTPCPCTVCCEMGCAGSTLDLKEAKNGF